MIRRCATFSYRISMYPAHSVCRFFQAAHRVCRIQFQGLLSGSALAAGKWCVSRTLRAWASQGAWNAQRGREIVRFTHPTRPSAVVPLGKRDPPAD